MPEKFEFPQSKKQITSEQVIEELRKQGLRPARMKDIHKWGGVPSVPDKKGNKKKK
jgi:hypothetical protein